MLSRETLLRGNVPASAGNSDVFHTWLGGHWAPWIVITLLFLYISAAISVQGYGGRRITACVESMRTGEVAGGTGTVGEDVAGATGASTADDATNGRAA